MPSATLRIRSSGAAFKLRPGESITFVLPVTPRTKKNSRRHIKRRSKSTGKTITVPLPVPSNQVALLAAYRVDTSSTSADAGVSAASRLPMGVTLTSCGATRAAVGGDNVQATSNVGTQTKSAMNLFDPASHYRFGEHIDGGTINCGLIADKETGAVTNGYNGELVNEVGIYARGATLRFAYLLVMSR